MDEKKNIGTATLTIRPEVDEKALEAAVKRIQEALAGISLPGLVKVEIEGIRLFQPPTDHHSQDRLSSFHP